MYELPFRVTEELKSPEMAPGSPNLSPAYVPAVVPISSLIGGGCPRPLAKPPVARGPRRQDQQPVCLRRRPFVGCCRLSDPCRQTCNAAGRGDGQHLPSCEFFEIMHGHSTPFYQITWHDIPADLLVVGMTTRDRWAHMLAVSLRSLSEYGSHELPSD